ncbi:MAG: protein translocase subunit SecF [Candidatus Sericytochromatia bacterium]
MSAVPPQPRFDFVGKRKLWYAITCAFLLPGIIFILMGGLKLGIDFTGGSMLELAFEKTPSVQQMRERLQAIDNEKFSDAQISILKDDTGQEIVSVRSKPIDDKEQVKVFADLKQSLGNFEQIRVEVVGPTIGEELRSKSLLATLIVMGMIVLYVSFRFSLDYAVCGIIALLHDVIIVVGSFAILGHFFNVEIDSLFITAVLTVAGFSIHDTIVTFDRIRENIGDLGRGKKIEAIVNDSLHETMTRNLHTSITTMIPLVTLTIFGGATIKYFAMAMLIGIVMGTWSSVFIACQLLVDWRNIFRGGGSKGARQRATA